MRWGDRGFSIVVIGHSNDASKFVICYVNKNEAKLGAGMEVSVPSEQLLEETVA
jgi:hypothetical protein